MALPNYRATSSPGPQMNQSMGGGGGSPASFNILKDRLRATPASPMGRHQDEVKANPFTHQQYGNNTFNPQKVGTKTLPAQGTPKPPKAPEKPLMPYMRYSRRVWDKVKNENPELKLWEIGRIIGQMWRDLAEGEKSEFTEDYESDKVEYEAKLKIYHNSPAYQAYIQAKAKGAPVVEEPQEVHSSVGVGRGKSADRRIDIQPAEDEEDPDDGLSVKHVAHARFMRNNKLINEVFNENMLPDVRSVVTVARMQVLKRQVQSLTMHQKKLEAELTTIEDKYDNKKRKFLESSEEFQEELKKHCVKAVDEEKFKEMVAEQLEKLKAERLERANGGASPPPESPAAVDPVDTRQVLQPVEKIDEGPDGQASDTPEMENGDADKEDGDQPKYQSMSDVPPPARASATPSPGPPQGHPVGAIPVANPTLAQRAVPSPPGAPATFTQPPSGPHGQHQPPPYPGPGPYGAQPYQGQYPPAGPPSGHIGGGAPQSGAQGPHGGSPYAGAPGQGGPPGRPHGGPPGGPHGGQPGVPHGGQPNGPPGRPYAGPPGGPNNGPPGPFGQYGQHGQFGHPGGPQQGGPGGPQQPGVSPYNGPSSGPPGQYPPGHRSLPPQ